MMKNLVVALGILFVFTGGAASRAAEPIETPAHWCSQADDPCSAPQQAIWDHYFASSRGISPASVPGIFTGSCYYKSHWQDSARENFGVIVLDQRAGYTYFGGRFGEFFPQNPWAGVTLEQALAEGYVRYDDQFRLNLYGEHADINVSNSPQHFIFYWLRQDESGQRVYLLGQADGEELTFCDLARTASR